MYKVEFIQIRKGYEINNYISYVVRSFIDKEAMWEWINAKIRRQPFSATYYKITCTDIPGWAYVEYIEALR